MKSKIGEIFSRGGSEFVIFNVVVFLSSGVAPLVQSSVGRPPPDYIGWGGTILLFMIFGTITALPSAVLLLLKFSNLKLNNLPTPTSMPFIAGIAYGLFFTLGMAGTSHTQLVPYFLVLGSIGSLFAQYVYFGKISGKCSSQV